MFNPFFRSMNHASDFFVLILVLVLIQGVVTPSKQLTLLLAILANPNCQISQIRSKLLQITRLLDNYSGVFIPMAQLDRTPASYLQLICVLYRTKEHKESLVIIDRSLEKSYYALTVLQFPGMSPWHNWIARPPPKGQVAGSIPAGDTNLIRVCTGDMVYTCVGEKGLVVGSTLPSVSSKKPGS